MAGTIETEYPFLDDALQFLRDKQALAGKDFARLSKIAKLKVVGSATISSAESAAQLRQKLVDSTKAGDDEKQFYDRIKGEIELRRSDANRILRTNTKQSYVDGMTKTLEKPHIDEAFGYVMFVATHDGRTRASHLALDGFVARVGSPEYETLKRALSDWNCRCSLIPLTKDQAEKRGIQVYKNMPIDIRREYGKQAV